MRPAVKETGHGWWARLARFWWLPLVPLTAVIMALAAAGVLPRWPGLVHLVALPPLDLYTDLRVLMLSTSTWWSFALLLLLVLAVRTTVLALLMGGLTRERVVLAAVFYGALVLPLALATQLLYISTTLLYSRLFWGSVLTVAVLAYLFAPLPWQAHPDRAPRLRDALARAWRGGMRVQVLLAYTVAVLTIGALAELFPALILPLVAVSAAATAVAARWLSRPAPPRPLLRLGASAVALVLIGSAWIATRDTGDESAPQREPREGSIMVMSGIDSSSGVGNMFRTDTGLLGYDCDQTYYFSYAGPGDGQPQNDALCPIRTGAPYTGEHTQRPLDEQVEAFAAQVEDLPRPLVVKGHSHGAWVAWKAVATGAAPEVDELVLAGPFPESRAGYRPPGTEGPGLPASDLLHLLVPLAETVDFHFDPNTPGAYQLHGAPETAAGIYAEPLPGDTRALSVTSSSDLPLMPSGWRFGADRDACPVRAPHPFLPTTPAYLEEVGAFLEGEPQPHCPAHRDWGKPVIVPFNIPDIPMDPSDEEPLRTLEE